MKKIHFIITALTAVMLFSCTKERMISEPGNLVPRTVEQDASLPSITVNGVKLHSEAFGHPDSTMIVCIHGGPGGDYRYMLNAKELSGYGYRVVFYDQRGSGLSERFSRSSYTSLGLGALDLFYNDLGAVISHYRTSPNQKVILFGSSWGAILATAYAGKYPNTIQGMILIEPGGLKWTDIEDYVKESRSFNLWSELINDATYLDQFISGKENQHEILDYKMGMLASKNDITGEDNISPGSNWRSGAVVSSALFEIGDDHQPDFSAGISNFSAPVLFIHSEKNKAYPLSWAQKIASAYPTVQLFRVSGVGHSGMITELNVWRQTTMPRIINYIQSL